MPTREQVSELLGSGPSPPHHDPTSKESVRAWVMARVAADDQMRDAKRNGKPDQQEPQPEEEP